MVVRFSQDVIPLSDIKTNPGKIIRQIQEAERPALITQRGRGVAVILGLEQYESLMEELEYLRNPEDEDFTEDQTV